MFTLKNSSLVTSSVGDVLRSNDNLFSSSIPILNRFKYDVLLSADDHGNGGNLSEKEKDFFLELPPGKNPKTRALGSQWRSQYSSDKEIIDAALDLYSRDFSYTHSVLQICLVTKKTSSFLRPKMGFANTLPVVSYF